MASIKSLLSGIFPQKDTDSRSAYDMWAGNYDDQPGNLMLDLDEQVFSGLLSEMNLHGKQIADIGCGTGRHWAKMIAQQPTRMTGFDVSAGMLEKLKEKFPFAETHLLEDDNLLSLADASCDLVCSTLTVAHIPSFNTAMKEWARVMKNDGNMLITDYHPAILEKGGKRTFNHNGKLVAVKNYVHSIDHIRAVARGLGLKEIRLIEKKVDGSVRHYYENKNALVTYETYKGMPVIYGIHFKKDR